MSSNNIKKQLDASPNTKTWVYKDMSFLNFFSMLRSFSWRQTESHADYVNIAVIDIAFYKIIYRKQCVARRQFVVKTNIDASIDD